MNDLDRATAPGAIDPAVANIIREQAQRDADYEDVGLAAIHVLYTGGT